MAVETGQPDAPGTGGEQGASPGGRKAPPGREHGLAGGGQATMSRTSAPASRKPAGAPG